MKRDNKRPCLAPVAPHLIMVGPAPEMGEEEDDIDKGEDASTDAA